MNFGSLTAEARGFALMPRIPVHGTTQFIAHGFLRHDFRIAGSPFDGCPVTVVAPLRPQLGVLQAQCADRLGNAPN